MAAPVITPISPLVFVPGETKDVTVTATDPDSGPPVDVAVSVTDTQGNTTPLLISVRVQDQLTYSVTGVPAGWAATFTGNVLSVTAP